jgi:hypothetical protein
MIDFALIIKCIISDPICNLGSWQATAHATTSHPQTGQRSSPSPPPRRCRSATAAAARTGSTCCYYLWLPRHLSGCPLTPNKSSRSSDLLLPLSSLMEDIKIQKEATKNHESRCVLYLCTPTTTNPRSNAWDCEASSSSSAPSSSSSTRRRR